MKKLLLVILCLLVIVSFGCDKKQSSSKYPDTDTQSGYTNREQTPKEQTPKEITVYITRTGSKYHRITCRYLSKSCIPIGLTDAKNRGYTPCSVCKPPYQSKAEERQQILVMEASNCPKCRGEFLQYLNCTVCNGNGLVGLVSEVDRATIPTIAENGSYYGELNEYGVPKTVFVRGYYRKDGTYVRSHYRSPSDSNYNSKSTQRYTPPVAENESYYGEISKTTGRPKDVYVNGYYRKDGTYVRGHYRSRPSRRK